MLGLEVSGVAGRPSSGFSSMIQRRGCDYARPRAASGRDNELDSKEQGRLFGAGDMKDGPDSDQDGR